MERITNRNLVKYKRNLPAKRVAVSIGTIITIVIIGLVIYLVLKNKTGSAGKYLNEETWDVQYNADGLPTKISIHRIAVRS